MSLSSLPDREVCLFSVSRRRVVFKYLLLLYAQDVNFRILCTCVVGSKDLLTCLRNIILPFLDSVWTSINHSTALYCTAHSITPTNKLTRPSSRQCSSSIPRPQFRTRKQIPKYVARGWSLSSVSREPRRSRQPQPRTCREYAPSGHPNIPTNAILVDLYWPSAWYVRVRLQLAWRVPYNVHVL